MANKQPTTAAPEGAARDWSIPLKAAGLDAETLAAYDCAYLGREDHPSIAVRVAAELLRVRLDKLEFVCTHNISRIGSVAEAVRAAAAALDEALHTARRTHA